MMNILDLGGFSRNSGIIIKDRKRFSDNTPHLKLEFDGIVTSDVIVTCDGSDPFNIIEAMVAADALRHMGYRNIELYCPFFPGARQDRYMDNGEALTCKVYATLVNASNFDRVYILDSHSDVTPALLDNCYNISNERFVIEVLQQTISDENEKFYIVSPDAGASKKIKQLHQNLIKIYPNCEVAYGSKHRDVKTGKINGFDCDVSDFEDRRAFMIDDICDGGGTFLGLANEMSNCSEINLLVTHGIFSRSEDALLSDKIDNIYTTNSIKQRKVQYKTVINCSNFFM